MFANLSVSPIVQLNKRQSNKSKCNSLHSYLYYSQAVIAIAVIRMKRRKLLVCWAALQAASSMLTCLLLLLTQHEASAGIVPPPWSDPAKNPCASMAGGWQLLYWMPLKKCFKIFTLGYPCPDTMELSPTPVSAKRKDVPTAECRCPPGTALSALTDACHTLYDRGPCPRGEYFQPIPEQVKR